MVKAESSREPKPVMSVEVLMEVEPLYNRGIQFLDDDREVR